MLGMALCALANRRNNAQTAHCINTLRRTLIDADLPDVIIDLIVNHVFAKFTIYALQHSTIDSFLFSSAGNLALSHYQYNTVNYGVNIGSISFSNNHLFITDDNGQLYTSSNPNTLLQNSQLIPIGNSTEHEFIVGFKRENTTYDDRGTYLFDNNTLQFFSYDHQKNALHCIDNKRLEIPCRIKRVVKSINNHSLIYYWCLMENGIIFKIVFDHHFFSRPYRYSRSRRQKTWSSANNHFISEYGPFAYDIPASCGKHTLDLEVFRLCPSSPPKFIEMVSGGEHLLLIDTEHRLWVYGNNQSGQCGIKKTTDTIVQPIKNQIFKNVHIQKVFAGPHKSAVIDASGRCFLFGQGIECTLRKPYKLLQRFERLRDVKIKTAACGPHHFVFVDTEDTVYGLGSNKSGQLSADLGNVWHAEPVQIDREYIGIGARNEERIVDVMIDGDRNYFTTTRNIM